MLLTGGQISVGISSCIVIAFTFLLFMSGYFLQQRTVQSLRVALQPSPDPSFVSDELSSSSRHWWKGGAISRDYHLSEYSPDWSRSAYIQAVIRYEEVCNAVILFAELKRQKSKAKRILLYPEHWGEYMKKRDGQDQRLMTSLRLLRKARLQFGASVQQMNSSLEYPDLGLQELVARSEVAKEFQRLLYLQPSGLIQNSRLLESLFSYESGLTVISVQDGMPYATPSAMILSPASKGRSTSNPGSADPESDTALAGVGRSVVLPHDAQHLLLRTSSLQYVDLPDDIFNLTQFLDTVGYVRLSDPLIKGPEFDIPQAQLAKARPYREGPRRIWEELYERYHSARIEVCGLDLEPVPRVASG